MKAKVIEDLSYDDFVHIANFIPDKFTMKQLKLVNESVALDTGLPLLDAAGSVFIAMAIKKDYSISGYETEKDRRVSEVIKLRGQDE